LGGGPEDCELKAETGKRTLQPSCAFVDDLLQPAWFDVQASRQVGEQLDELVYVPVKRPPGHIERLEVVVPRSQWLHRRGGANAPCVSGDACGDLNVVLARRGRLREDAAEQRQQFLQVFGQR